MKILHSADWHLDAPLTGRTEQQADFLRREMQKIPGKIAKLCRKEACQMLLLSGDLFDGAYTKESYRAMYEALEELGIPVFIAPGNHDYCRPSSVYMAEHWPENVHIFTRPVMEKVYVQALDCTVYGAGYDAMDCPALLEDFHADGQGRWHIGVLHGDATTAVSPYCPVNAQQVRRAGLDYVALGHIHKGGSFRSGDSFCAWPGCPMGHGYDEPGIKGVIVVELEETVQVRAVPLDTPRFYDETLEVGEDPEGALASLLPGGESFDFYRVTLEGYADSVDTQELRKKFAHIPNLELRDRTVPETTLWEAVGEDSLEGMYFGILKDALDTDSDRLQRCVKLAARISRQILDGQEVVLP